MILPDDIDEKAEIVVGETDTEDEEYGDEDQGRAYWEHMPSREGKLRSRNGKQRGRQRDRESKQLGNGLQLSLGRKADDVYILKQEMKLGVPVEGTSTHSGLQARGELPEKSSPGRRLAALLTASMKPTSSESSRPRWQGINPQGLGLNIWPDHPFFARQGQHKALEGADRQDSKKRTRHPRLESAPLSESETTDVGGRSLQTASGGEVGGGNQRVGTTDEELPSERRECVRNKKGFIETVWDWAWPWRSRTRSASEPSK